MQIRDYFNLKFRCFLNNVYNHNLVMIQVYASCQHSQHFIMPINDASVASYWSLNHTARNYSLDASYSLTKAPAKVWFPPFYRVSTTRAGGEYAFSLFKTSLGFLSLSSSKCYRSGYDKTIMLHIKNNPPKTMKLVLTLNIFFHVSI